MASIWNRFGGWLLGKALASACKQAGLTAAVAQLSFGNVEYLRSSQRSAQASEAIVMLHGAAADKTSWARFAKCLDRTRQLVIPDLPGHGNSTAELACATAFMRKQSASCNCCPRWESRVFI